MHLLGNHRGTQRPYSPKEGEEENVCHEAKRKGVTSKMFRGLQFQGANSFAPDGLNMPKEGIHLHPAALKTPTRVEFIDLTRGLLLLLMVTAHALFLAGVPAFTSSKPILWLLGGMPKIFVILSGFSIGYIYSLSSCNFPQLKYRLIRRAKEIFLVMFISNIFFLATKHLVQGNAAILGTLDWWIGLFTFQTPYSLSGVLIPVAILCLITPLVLYAHIKLNTHYILPTMVGISFLTAWAQKLALEVSDAPFIIDILLINGAGGFKVLPIVCSGLIGLALGLNWKQYRSIPFLTAVLASLFCIANFSLFPEYPSPVLSLAKSALLAPAKFGLILAAGTLIAVWMKQTSIGNYLALIGKYSLFCFLAHRIILQGLQFPLQLTFNLTPEGLFAFLLIGTLGILGILCFFRTKNPRFTNILRKAYL